METRKYKIRVLEKSLNILELFKDKRGAFTAMEISDMLNMNKSTCFRIIKNLEDCGSLEKDQETAKYILGIKVYSLGMAAEPHTRLKSTTRPFLEDLVSRTGETVHLGILHNGEALYLDKIEGNKTVRVISRIGAKLPAHCSGIGKILLANLSKAEIEQIIREKGLRRFTSKTITDLKSLQVEMSRARKRGYVIDNEEIEEGLKCAAAPVQVQNRVIAGISIAVPSERFDKNESRIIGEVKSTAFKISGALSCEGKYYLKDQNARSPLV